MTVFTWDASYLIGIESVDQQHQGLVNLINELDDAIASGQSEPQVELLFERLIAYATEHFADEERLMAEAGPELAQHLQRHKVQHENFSATVSMFSKQLACSHSTLGAALLDYLVKWLAFHILREDKEMGRLLGSGAAETTAESSCLDRYRLLDSAVAERNLLGALHESELRFRHLANSVPLLIWMAEPNRSRNFFNERWSEFTGLTIDALKADGWQQTMHPEDLPQFQATLGAAEAEGRPFRLEYRLRDHQGEYHWFLDTAVPRQQGERFAGYIGSCVDISDHKEAELLLTDARDRLGQQVQERTEELMASNHRLEQEQVAQAELISQLKEAHSQLLQSEKMASIGQLAAGVAHEINNPVGYIISNMGALEEYVGGLLRLVDHCGQEAVTLQQAGVEIPGLEKLKKEIDYDYIRGDIENLLAETREGAHRVKQIVKDLKDFSHVDDAEWQLADINRGLESTLNLVWNELKYKAEVTRDLAPLPPIECLPSQLNQVFVNLLVNAAQAIPERGTIGVRSFEQEGWVVVEISDSGCGIPAEIRSRIFDPFFTTKAVGKGTGLGLSIVYGIVQRHQGRIEVESESGVGTTFRILLPMERGELEKGDGTTPVVKPVA